MNNIDKYAELIAKYFTGEILPGEKEELFAWMEADEANRKFFDEMVEVWSMTKQAPLSPFEVDVVQAWSNIESSVTETGKASARIPESPVASPSRSAKIVPLSKIVWRWSVAAAILCLAVAGSWWVSRTTGDAQWVEVQTLQKEKKEIVLPDNSHVWLNENSKIVYDLQFVKRSVLLEGEAFFDVEHLGGRPFEILSGNATTTVLGTTFNVRAYPTEDRIEVTVQTGKVALAVTKREETSVFLEAGESGFFDKKEEIVRVAEKIISNADSWKTEKLDFDEAEVKDIILALERYFDIEISVSDPTILQCHYSANFSQPALPAAMENLAFGLGLRLEKTDNGYLLSGSGCLPDH